MAAVTAAQQGFRFAQYFVSESQIFFRSKLSVAFVNLKPIAPGHVLVSPERIVRRFNDLTPAEVSDLFMTVQRVGNVVEERFDGDSLTIAVQDGPSAGQTVPHVHVHIIPRRVGDWENNDDIYKELDKESKEMRDREKGRGMDNDTRVARTEEDMAKEATFLRAFFEPEENVYASSSQ